MRVRLPPPPAGVSIVVSELVLVPLVDVDPWVSRRLGDGDFTRDRVETTTTASGWPALLAYGVRAGIPTLRVFFRFEDLGAFAEATGDLSAAWTVLREARPEYDELATLRQLFA